MLQHMRNKTGFRFADRQERNWRRQVGREVSDCQCQFFVLCVCVYKLFYLQVCYITSPLILQNGKYLYKSP